MIPGKVISILFLAGWLPLMSFTQNGEDLYKKNCAACHTIGGGRLVGPDLAGVTGKADRAWLTRFIRNSAEMIRSGDAAAVAIGREYNNLLMPGYNGSDAEIGAIISYIGSKGGTPADAIADTFLNHALTGHISRGKDLFTGRLRFSGSGVSCISCHVVHDAGITGGNLAKSLNLSYAILKGPGIRALLATPAFPAMTAAYRDHPLTAQEIYDLSAYLKSVSEAMIGGAPAQASMSAVIPAAAGFLAGILVLAALWRQRKRCSVNHKIFSRQLPTE